MAEKKKKVFGKIGSGLLAAFLAVTSVSFAVGCKDEKGKGGATSQNLSSIESVTSVNDENSSSILTEESQSSSEESIESVENIESVTSETSESEISSEEFSSSDVTSVENVTSSETADSSEDFTNAAPSFTMQDTSGRNVELSDFYGKPIVVNFWATWCPPCRAELPDFQAAYERYGGEVQFLMVATMWDETAAAVRNFASNNGYTFPIYYDVYGEGTETYDINGIPLSLFIDRNGELKYSYNYMITEDLLTASIQQILK